MKNSFFSRFTPNETKFFPLLKQLSDVMIEASALLIKTTQTNDNVEQTEIYKQIKAYEKQGDTISRVILAELNKSFITPFDREDIQQLASFLDDVIDGINSSAKRIMLYKPMRIPEDASKLAHCIYKAALCIGKITDELPTLSKNADELKKCCTELHDTEHDADDLYEHFITKLFAEEKDAVELVKLKEILSEMEKTTDTQDHVGKVVRTIIVKYA